MSYGGLRFTPSPCGAKCPALGPRPRGDCWTKLLLLVAAVTIEAAAAAPVNWPIATPPAGHNPATFAVPRNEWMQRFDANLRRAAAGPIDLLFDGDSITEWWSRAGASVWQARYAPLRAATFGIGGDRTETLLWRIRQGQLNGLRPKLIVLMIGTNNSGRDSAEQIAEGVVVVADEIVRRCPESHLLVLGIFPRAERPDHPLRTKIAQVNRLLASASWADNASFLDIGHIFLSKDGTISREIMPDYLHLSEKGYVLWADAIQAAVQRHVITGH